jgi:hypothetical protein
MVNVDRLRVGSSKESDLLIYHYEESLGWILFFAAGSNPDECANSFPKFNPSKSNFLIPYMDNHKWGFIDSTQQIVISPIYDFVRLFNDGVAKVKLDSKWGLINEQGKRITEIKYDKIFPAEDNIMRVLVNNKVGYLDTNGIEIIPPEYDSIDFLNKANKYAKTQKGNKYGYATKKGVLCPPIFEDVFDFSLYVCTNAKNTTMYGNVKYKGERYLITDGEFMYKYECGNEEIIIFEDSKIKISELNIDE